MKGEIPYPTPIVLGHEGAGTIKEIGPNVSSVKVGDRCIVSFISSCGLCKQCRSGFANHCEKHYENTHNQLDGTLRLTDQNDKEIYQMHKFGAFSELQVVPESSLFKIPDELSSSAAALIGCCVTTGLGGIINQENVPIGSTVAVFGCGGVGLNVIQGAKILNSTKIIAVDVFEHKLEFAYKFGATDVINAKSEDPVEKIKDITGGGVDYSFDSFGSSAIMKQAVESLSKRGTAALVGLASPSSDVAVNMVDLVRNEKNIIGSFYGYGSPLVTMKKIVDMYLSGKVNIDDLIRKVFKLEEINEAFADIDKGEDGRGVIVF
jgi:S-(hydroxymethyl)glutathione dehydrogenase/alcohol dehydrogenase